MKDIPISRIARFYLAVSIMIISVLIIFPQGVLALSFSTTSVGGTGSINTGNGYFDDPQTAFGYTGDRNVYAIAEDTQVIILEPISWVSGGSPTNYIAINSSLGTLTDAVVHNGYLYFIDGGVLKKKKSRDVENPVSCESTDTSAGGCIIVVSTTASNSMKVLDGVLYFNYLNTIKYLDSLDNVITSSIPLPSPGGVLTHQSFGITNNASVLTVYATGNPGANTYYIFKCTSAGCATTGTSYGNPTGSSVYSTYFTTSNYVYVLFYSTIPFNDEVRFRVSNNTKTSINYVTSNAIPQPNRVYVGGISTVGLMVVSSTTYETFNSDEVGVDSLITVPAELTYDTRTIESLDATYYNRSTIYLQYNVVLDSLNANNILLDFDDYRWIISLTDPNGVSQDIVQTPNCQYSGILDTTCQIYSSMGLNAPSTGWLAGSWTAKLYEINIATANRALITTSSSFTVLNTSLENQSIAPPPFIPITAGTAPQAITKIDNFMALMGLGVNSVSKLLFAMIIIGIAATVGLIWGNGNVAMVFAFIPYAFFTFIDYIPKWIFIITIILIAIVSRAFR